MPEARIRPHQVLAYEEEGPPGAPALLLITGLGGLKEGWFRQVPHFRERFRVITFDNRGMGGSTVVDAPLRMVDLADDARLLLDHLGVDVAHLWGVSMGGKVAQELALGWPERVGRVVLENTTPGDDHRVEGRAPSPLRELQGADAETIYRELVPLLFGRAYLERNERSLWAFARSRARHPPDRAGLARQWEAYDAFDSWDRLPALRHRTLLLWGAEDALCHVDNAHRLASRLPDARVVAIEGGGHSVHIERPDAVNAAVERFLLEP